jgi:hypothetical protein
MRQQIQAALQRKKKAEKTAEAIEPPPQEKSAAANKVAKMLLLLARWITACNTSLVFRPYPAALHGYIKLRARQTA